MKAGPTITALTAALAALLTAAPRSEGAATFTQAGDDLVLTISPGFSLTSTGTFAPTDGGALIFPDAYSAAPPAIAGTPFDTPLGITLDGNADAFAVLGHGINFETSPGSGTLVYDDTDLVIVGLWLSGYDLAPGDSIPVPAGVFTITDFFLDPDATLPDQPTGSAFFAVAIGADEGAIATSVTPLDAAAVPEPTRASLLALALGGMALRRRREKANP